MGYEIGFFAFSECPDVEILENIKWLESWRLYERESSKAWYLNGLSNRDIIDFAIPPETKNISPSPDIVDLINKINNFIAENCGYKSLFDKVKLAQCAELSKKLNQKVIWSYGDDEDKDGAFIFNSGKIQKARFKVDWNCAIVVNLERDIEIEWFYEKTVDPDSAEPRILHQIANEEITDFLTAEQPWMGSWDFDLNNSKFNLISSKGKIKKKKLWLKSELLRKHGKDISFRNLVSECSSHINLAIEKGLISDEKSKRLIADDNIISLGLYVNDIYPKDLSTRPRHVRYLIDFIWNLGAYTALLRPKPKFRYDDLGLEERRFKLWIKWKALEVYFKIWSN